MAKFLDDAGVQHLISRIDERYLTKTAADEKYMTKAAANNEFVSYYNGYKYFKYNKLSGTIYGEDEDADFNNNVAYLDPHYGLQLFDVVASDQPMEVDEYANIFVNVDIANMNDDVVSNMTVGSMTDGKELNDQYFGPHRAIIRFIGRGWINASVSGAIIRTGSQSHARNHYAYKDPPKIVFTNAITFQGDYIPTELLTAGAPGTFGAGNPSAYTLTYIRPWLTGTYNDYKSSNGPATVILDWMCFPEDGNNRMLVIAAPQFINANAKSGEPIV